MIKLHPVNNDTKHQLWCGPCVVASIVDRPISEIDDAFKDGLPSEPITGTTTGQVIKVLASYGFRMEAVRHEWNAPGGMARQPTLAQWCETQKRDGLTYIVNVTRHWVIETVKVIDPDYVGEIRAEFASPEAAEARVF